MLKNIGCEVYRLVAAGALALLIGSGGAALAQTAGAGTITGTLTDPTGSVVPGATVVVRNVDTGTERSTESNGSGIYLAAFLQPGRYQVSASREGFATVIRKDLTLQVGQTLRMDLSMPLKAVQQEVTITGEAPLIDLEKTEASQVVSHNMVENLPIIGRRWDNFVLLTPGVTTDGGLVSYRGISGLYNNNSVDGANNNQAFFSEARGRSTVPYTYSIDSIGEFQVSASDYSAEFGQAAGGVVNAVTKSGGNDYHGDLFYFLRYPSFNALDSFNKSKGIYTQAIHQQQQFGGSSSGRIIRDKLFYFLTYDGSRKVFPVSYTSSSTFPLACPPPPKVSASQCAAANGYLASLVGAYPRTGVQDLAFGKIDYQLNPSNHLSANFNFDNYHAPNAYSAGTSYSNLSVTANGPAVTHTRFFVTNWNSILSPTTINNLRFQWGLDREIIGANQGGPSVSIASVMTYGMPNALPRPAFPDEHRLQFADTLSMNKGTHALKLGFDVNLIHELLINIYQGGGLYTYTGSGPAAFSNWVLDLYGIADGTATGKHYANFSQVTDPITGVGKDDFYNNDYAGFFEDSWKVRSNLTLNLGVRYEIQTVPQPPKPNTLTPLLTQYTTTINTDSNNLAPRIGIAWQPFKDTVVRAGYGMFYAKTSNSTFYAIRVENGIYQQTFNCLSKDACAPIFPNLIFTPPGPAPAAPFSGALAPQVINTHPPLAAMAVHGLVPDFVNPMVHEGELTIERQLPGNLSVSAAYLFSRGMHLPVFIDANVMPSTGTKSYAVLDASNNLAQTISVPFYNNGRINPGTGVILNGYSVLNSWYHGLVLTFRKPMSHDIELLFNYTFAKAIDDGACPGAYGTFYGTDVTFDPYNQHGEHALSDLDQRHHFVGSLVWVPRYFQKLSSKPLRTALDGFAFSTIVTEATGQPITGVISGYPSGGVDGGLTGGEVSNAGSNTGGRIPWVGRNTFAGPGLHNVDLRVSREFVFHERYRLQFRGEAFNLFNQTNISGETTTAYNYVKVGTGACTTATYSSTNGCLTPNGPFLAPTSSTSSNGLYGSRQLQVSAKFVF